MRLNKTTKLWEFKIPYDIDFEQRFPNTANKQKSFWNSTSKINEVQNKLQTDISNGHRLRPSTNSLVFIGGDSGQMGW